MQILFYDENERQTISFYQFLELRFKYEFILLFGVLQGAATSVDRLKSLTQLRWIWLVGIRYRGQRR